jgi:drug/metabolite transporter superfamily protein YnfA
MKMTPLRIFLWALAALALIGGTFIYYVNLKSAISSLRESSILAGHSP